MSRSATSTRPTHPTSTNQTSPHYAEALRVRLVETCRELQGCDGEFPQEPVEQR